MIRFIRNYEMGDAANEIGKFYNIADNRAEVMEFGATEAFSALNISFNSKGFRLKKDILITAILRKGTLIIPSGDTCIMNGDRVIITSSKANRIRNLNEILSGR
jgi:trk system potassium uptake protein TrkA